MRLRALAATLATATSLTALAAPPSSAAPVAPAASAPTSAYLPGTTCRAFPASNYWHADISSLPVHPRSAQWKSNMQSWRSLHPDFGPSYGEQPVPYGIPITITRSTTRVPVRFGYADESDRVRYPLSTSTRIEGGWSADGDRHAIVVDATTCTLYETWDTHRYASGWYAGSGAVWSLTSNALRPAGWTSADAAGLPILPGLAPLRRDLRHRKTDARAALHRQKNPSGLCAAGDALRQSAQG